MKEIKMAQYYLPIRESDAYIYYKVKVGDRLFGFHNLDKLNDEGSYYLEIGSGKGQCLLLLGYTRQRS